MSRAPWFFALSLAACALDRDGRLVGGGGAGGSAGAGGALFDCETVDDCGPADTTCSTRTCIGGLCGSDDAEVGTDCTEDNGQVCDGQGACVECAGDGGCTPPEVCSEGRCIAPDGAPCAAGDECDSGFCVDDVCCSSDCVSNCSSCVEALTGVSDGVCAPVLTGTDPDDDCPADQQCDGEGVCIACVAQWSSGHGDTREQTGDAVAVDAAGNAVVVGHFRGELNFGGNVLTSAVTSKHDGFVVKLAAASGAHMWSRRFGDGAQDQFPEAVAVDANGDVIVAGRFRGTIDLGGGPITSSARHDIFVAKLAGDTGNHVWSRRYGDGSVDQHATGVAVYSNGDVVMTGYFHGPLDFGGTTLNSVGTNYNIVVARLAAANGAHVWSRRYGDGTQDQRAEAVAVDGQGNAVVVGQFRGTLDFGGATLSSAGADHDALVVKLEPTMGNHVWSHAFGNGAEPQFAEGVGIDAASNVVVVGRFRGAVDFGGGEVTSAGSNHDIFVTKLEPTAGDEVWTRPYGDGDDDQFAEAVAVTGAGDVLVTGRFTGSIDFGGGLLTSAGSGHDLFTLKLAAAGTYLCSGRYGDGGDDQLGLGVAVDAAGNGIYTGRYYGEIDFGLGALTAMGTSGDLFVAKLGP